jgi:hypothetical protein
LTIFGCKETPNNNKKSVDKPKKVSITVAKQIEEPKPNYKASRMIITLYDKLIPSSKSTLNYGPFSTDIIYETTDPKILDAFDLMTKHAKRSGYCCCPDRNYTISFYDKTNKYKDYFVDTVESKDNVIIFESSYQFSYIVDKVRWLNFLALLKQISYNEYFISELKAAREVYKYTIENDLPIITSNRVSNEWMNFDGDFNVRVAVVGEILDEAKIYANIKRAYPNDTFKIETISEYKTYGPIARDDCYEEIILHIFCNKDFYDKFKIYSPKSFYEKALAEFYVIGTREKLNKIDNLAKKEE